MTSLPEIPVGSSQRFGARLYVPKRCASISRYGVFIPTRSKRFTTISADSVPSETKQPPVIPAQPPHQRQEHDHE